MRRAIRKQPGYVKGSIKHIERLQGYYAKSPLTIGQGLIIKTIVELYRQQEYMFDNKTHSVENLIVSICQPQVRPVARGIARTNVEFGAKLAISLVDGFAYLEKLSWDNFNEGMTPIQAVENYRLRHGFNPESIHVEKIYRTRDNIRYGHKHGIRISEPKLGRPPKKYYI